jgi:hypothetical protein
MAGECFGPGSAPLERGAKQNSARHARSAAHPPARRGPVDAALDEYFGELFLNELAAGTILPLEIQAAGTAANAHHARFAHEPELGEGDPGSKRVEHERHDCH